MSAVKRPVVKTFKVLLVMSMKADKQRNIEHVLLVLDLMFVHPARLVNLTLERPLETHLF